MTDIKQQRAKISEMVKEMDFSQWAMVLEAMSVQMKEHAEEHIMPAYQDGYIDCADDILEISDKILDAMDH